MNELKAELILEGAEFETASDTEVILVGYMLHGSSFIKKLNGIFAAAVWDCSYGLRRCAIFWVPWYNRRSGEKNRQFHT